MVPIAFTVLKWIGIILLLLLLLALLLLCIVLFVPVRYRVRTELGEGWRVYGYGSFLLHLIHVSFRVEDGEKKHVIRVFGWPLKDKKFRGWRSGRRKKSVRSQKAVGRRRDKRESEEEKDIREKTDKQRGEREELSGETGAEREGMASRSEEVEVTEWIEGRPRQKLDDRRQKSDDEQQRTDSRQQGTDDGQQDSGNGRVEIEGGRSEEQRVENGPDTLFKKIFQHIRHFLLSIRRRFVKMYKSLRRGFSFLKRKRDGQKEKTAAVWEILMDENTPQFFSLAWQSIVCLWKHSKPRRLRGRVVFGTGDPCTTGQILGAIGMCYAVIGSGVEITPDFEQTVLDGELDIQGRVQIGILIYLAGRILLSEKWKHLKDQLKTFS